MAKTKKLFNLNKEHLRVGLNIPNANGKVVFRSYAEDGKLLGETIEPHQRVSGRLTGLNASFSSPPDFMDRIAEHGPGKYRITATFKNNPSEKYSVNFEITK